MGIKTIRIRNFKSIRDSGQIKIEPLNVLIGPNGAGKSNFISFFKFLNKLFEQQLQLYISQNGRAENFLYFGRKMSSFLAGTITFDNPYQNEYDFTMVPDQAGNLLFADEYSNLKSSQKRINIPGRPESVLKDDDAYRNTYLRQYLASLKIFHFHDTSANSRIKQPTGSSEYAYLYEDGGNIAAFLYWMQEAHPANFKMIERVIQSIAPFFDKFYLQPDEINKKQMFLRWQAKGSDQLFTAHNLSDGTLRMICLTTLLMQPKLPGAIIIDEPELGLHPFAINKLASMLKSASLKSQIIISTQSVNLLDQFEAKDVLVVESENNQTVFKRQNEEQLNEWLKDYSIGELWDKNVLGGRP